MHAFKFLHLILLLQATATLIVDPVYEDVLSIETELVSIEYSESLAVNLTQFTLPGFSTSTIVLDLRHLLEIPTQNGEPVFKLYFSITDQQGVERVTYINDTIIGTNQYQLTVTEEAKLLIYFKVISNYLAYQYMLRNSVSLALNYANNRIPSQDSSYVAVVESINNVNLPKNKPNLQQIEPFYLENQRIDSDLIPSPSYSQSTSYWGTQSTFVVPYFPYFSNCDGEGNMIEISQALQSPQDCNLVSLKDTVWINQFNFGSSARADNCNFQRTCMHKGSVEKTEYPQWQTLPSLLSLFSISKEQVRWEEYKFDMQFQKDQLVACKISSSEGTNSSDYYPLNVKLTIGYYQVSRIQKRIIRCTIDYTLYVSSTADFEYQLQIVSEPLSHTYIMLSFGFEWYVYMIVFVIIGIISNLEHLVLWLYHYWVSEATRPSRVMVYLRVFKEVIKGTVLAIILFLAVVVVVNVVMNGKMFDTKFYSDTQENSHLPRVLWDYILEFPTNNYDSTTMVSLRSGRMGMSFAVIGIVIILFNCHFFIGKEKPKQDYKDYDILGRVFKPLDWNTGKFLFGTFLYIAFQLFFIYFAYSTLYSKNIWAFIVTMKMIQMIMEEIAKNVYEDILPCLPLKIITDITAYLNTLSANDFYDFLFSFLVDVAMTMIQKAYISQLQNIVVEKIQEKSQELNKFYQNIMNDAEEDDQYLSIEEDNNSEADNQRVFIYREAQEVKFWQQEINEVYVQQPDQDILVEIKNQDSFFQAELKRKYLNALQRQYKKHHHQLFKEKEKQKQKEKERERQRARAGKVKETFQAPSENKEKNKELNNRVSLMGEEEKMEQQSAIFQLLIDNIALLYTFFLQPFVVLTFWMTYYESAILSSYGITYNTVVLYNLSAIVIALFAVINVILIFHILQSYLNISFQEQINDLLGRFFSRDEFWKANDEDLNYSLNPMLRGADHYCLSSQFFFILTIYLSGMILVLLGMAIMFNTSYNLFDDVATIPIIIFWIAIISFFGWLLKIIAQKLNFWDFQNFKQKQNPASLEKNLVGVRDFPNQSDYKTENILFIDDLSKDNLMAFGQSRKTIDRSKNSSSDNSKKYIEQMVLEPQERKESKKRNLKIANFGEKDQILLAKKRLQTICKKLEPLFEKDSFKMEYALKNRQYIKQNIERILPLVDQLPQLRQIKNLANTQLQGKKGTTNQIYRKKTKQNVKQQHANKNQKAAPKHMQPVVGQIILEWLRATQKSRQLRIAKGVEYEESKKTCRFCYNTWSLYYDDNTQKQEREEESQQNVDEKGGICLECSLRLVQLKQISETQGLKKETTKTNKDPKLNVIKEESEDQLRDSQEHEALLKNNSSFSKQHQD